MSISIISTAARPRCRFLQPTLTSRRSRRHGRDGIRPHCCKACPPERLSRYFVHGIDGSYTIAKSVRELCTFSAHSLTRDPPFSRIDLLSCRNLLIYLDLELQGAVIPAFHYSLVPDGILLLGSSETVNRHESLFKTLDRSHRIFQKRDVPSPPLRMTGREGPRDAQTTKGGSPTRGVPFRSGLSRLSSWAHARVMERFAPPFVIVTADAEALHYSSNLARYMDFPPGTPSQNVLLMARTGLRAPLRAALKQAAEAAVASNGLVSSYRPQTVERGTSAC